MVRLELAIHLNYEIAYQRGDFIFNIHAALTPCQTVVSEDIVINQQGKAVIYIDPTCRTRFMQMSGDPGVLKIDYHAVVDIEHYFTNPDWIEEVPIAQLPPTVIPYLYPSRYCQSDRLRKFATREFSHIKRGYGLALGIQDWVRQRTTFTNGSSNVTTSAIDTLTEQVGVCRDFAHLMIALCRAVNMPARFVTGIDYGADPQLGPTDFHAYVEVFLGHRWYLFEPSGVSPPMGLVRIGTGRDAADVSFSTMFGTITSQPPKIFIQAIHDPDHGLMSPIYVSDAISSMAEIDVG